MSATWRKENAAQLVHLGEGGAERRAAGRQPRKGSGRDRGVRAVLVEAVEQLKVPADVLPVGVVVQIRHPKRHGLGESKHVGNCECEGFPALTFDIALKRLVQANGAAELVALGLGELHVLHGDGRWGRHGAHGVQSGHCGDVGEAGDGQTDESLTTKHLRTLSGL